MNAGIPTPFYIFFLNPVYYINTSEIPSEFSGVNMISSHVKITCYFTLGNNMPFSHKKYKDVLLYDRNIIGPSSASEIFGYFRKTTAIFGNVQKRSSEAFETFWKIFGNLRKVVGNLRIMVKNVVNSMFL